MAGKDGEMAPVRRPRERKPQTKYLTDSFRKALDLNGRRLRETGMGIISLSHEPADFTAIEPIYGQSEW